MFVDLNVIKRTISEITELKTAYCYRHNINETRSIKEYNSTFPMEENQISSSDERGGK